MQMNEKICLTGLLLGMNHGCIITNPKQSELHCSGNHPSSPSTEKFIPSAGKVMLTMFWDSQGVLLTHFQKCGENVNYTSYCEALLKLQDEIRRKLPGQLAREVLLNHQCQTPYSTSNPGEIQEL
jgi:hypothetical protein